MRFQSNEMHLHNSHTANQSNSIDESLYISIVGCFWLRHSLISILVYRLRHFRSTEVATGRLGCDRNWQVISQLISLVSCNFFRFASIQIEVQTKCWDGYDPPPTPYHQGIPW